MAAATRVTPRIWVEANTVTASKGNEDQIDFAGGNAVGGSDFRIKGGEQ